MKFIQPFAFAFWNISFNFRWSCSKNDIDIKGWTQNILPTFVLFVEVTFFVALKVMIRQDYDILSIYCQAARLSFIFHEVQSQQKYIFFKLPIEKHTSKGMLINKLLLLLSSFSLELSVCPFEQKKWKK